jgi:hypothetical protein
MARIPTAPDPIVFRLASFKDLVAARDPIIGEDANGYKTFHQALTATLVPATPYECVIAENLIAIEWELVQRRRMRDATIRQAIRDKVRVAVIDRYKKEVRDESWQQHLAAGEAEEDWEEPEPDDFDEDELKEAAKSGNDIAERALSSDHDIQAAAYQEIIDLGLRPIELMSEAYGSKNIMLNQHEEQLQDLERRRREVKRDFDALQRLRPIKPDLIEAVAVDE